jgi:hypothetical protein
MFPTRNTKETLTMTAIEFAKGLHAGAVAGKTPRILPRLEGYFEKNALSGGVKFSHYRPARYFAEHIGTLKKSVVRPPFRLDTFQP